MGLALSFVLITKIFCTPSKKIPLWLTWPYVGW